MWAYNYYLYYNIIGAVVLVIYMAVIQYKHIVPTLRYSTNNALKGEFIGAYIFGTVGAVLGSASSCALMVKAFSVMLGAFISNGIWDVVA